MHTRRLTALLLGLWLGASLWMDWTSMVGFSTVTDAYQSMEVRQAKTVERIGAEPLRQILRFQAAELSRRYSYDWGLAQCLFGTALLVVVLFTTNGNKIGLALAGGMLLVVLGMQFGIMPRMLEQDRALDFPNGDVSREEAAFHGSHNTYIGLEILKLLAGAGLGGLLLYRSKEESGRRHRRRSTEEVDVINYAQNSRVNR